MLSLMGVVLNHSDITKVTMQDINATTQKLGT
jgi:hypothetical protein